MGIHRSAQAVNADRNKDLAGETDNMKILLICHVYPLEVAPAEMAINVESVV